MKVNENWKINKEFVEGSGGIVSSHHFEASNIGIDVLNNGGNAIDAALSMGLALGVLEPWMSGIGGCGFMVYYESKSQNSYAIDFGVKSPINLDVSKFKIIDGGKDDDLFGWPLLEDNINIHGPLSMAVPGYISGVSNALNNFGTMPWKEVIDPAVQLSKRGLGVDWYATLRISLEAKYLRNYPSSRNIFLEDELPPISEDPVNLKFIKNKKLCNSYEILQQDGPSSFYSGELSEILLKDLKAVDSIICDKDLSSYKSFKTYTQKSNYRNTEIHVAPGLNAGPSLLDALKELELSWMPNSGIPDSSGYSAYAKSLITAYENRLKNMGAESDDGCTTHLSVIDKEGNMVSLTQTLLSCFGSRLVLPESGVLMNNGIMWFDPRPNRPNSLCAGSKPLSNMCPAIVIDNSGKKIALGASGGRRIFPAVFQLISFLVDYNMTLNDAFNTYRIDYSGENRILANNLIDSNIIDELNKILKTYNIPDSVVSHLYSAPNAVMVDAKNKRFGNAYIPSPWSSTLITD